MATRMSLWCARNSTALQHSNNAAHPINTPGAMVGSMQGMLSTTVAGLYAKCEADRRVFRMRFPRQESRALRGFPSGVV